MVFLSSTIGIKNDKLSIFIEIFVYLKLIGVLSNLEAPLVSPWHLTAGQWGGPPASSVTN